MSKFVADSSVSPQGLKWAVDPVADVVTTAGDLIYGTAADTVARLGIGTAGQVLKVNSGATAPEWGAASSPSFVGALAYASNLSMSMTGGSAQAINLASEEFDTDGFHSTSSNTSRMTIPSGKAGKYLITATFDVASITSNTYYLFTFRKNGGTLTAINRGFSGNAGGNNFQGGSLSTIVDAIVNDYFEIAYQNGQTETQQMWCRLGIQYLGA